jgi:hypothetical protein
LYFHKKKLTRDKAWRFLPQMEQDTHEGLKAQPQSHTVDDGEGCEATAAAVPTAFFLFF